MHRVQWCSCPTKWKSTEREAAAGVGESFTCQKSPLPLSPKALCRKAKPAQLKPSCLTPDEQEGKPDVSSCPC